jgi:hypothetical protein
LKCASRLLVLVPKFENKPPVRVIFCFVVLGTCLKIVSAKVCRRSIIKGPQFA